ncbi:hypothetical protein D9619_009125 [Psilocybe cf. subviscida]|uniref:Histone chaperone RTT106/FACT complex subunit SPT16-like middle domain-containing protein n=1 Tax=Psilocybe cf. subviscida TaxID=2480587 RepID=A0A8H5BU76_9AGAR|nr:hypothetical protein D9619_009125 [Psilocybe cf. subviscida]
MAQNQHYLRAVMPTLPTEIAHKIRSMCVSADTEATLENFVRFLLGGTHSGEASKAIQDQWAPKQAAVKEILKTLGPSPDPPEKKRGRDDEDSTSPEAKKPRLSPQTNGNPDTGLPLYTLHAISATSPVRKKVDITVHENAIVMVNPTSRAVESTLPLATIKRAFIVPTRGKSKPHWTVIILSSDIPDKGKPAPGTTSENHQIILGIDAVSTSPLTTTTYTKDEAAATVSPKGSETLPFLRAFLSHLGGGVSLMEPSKAAVFKSACTGVGSGASASPDGIPGVEAYRAAKPGNLWFAREGILWGESKPCEFWPVGDLLGRSEGLRLVGSGRTFTVVLTRRLAKDGEVAEGEEDMGEETEFGMVDGKEREGINEWVRNHRHLFGKATSSQDAEPAMPPPRQGPMTIRDLLEDEDEEDDEDFEASVSDLDGSERLSSGDSSSEDEGGEGSDEEGEAEGSEEEDVEMQELDPAHHPLLRPGAMPKMSKAAMEMAVGIVEESLAGPEDVDELDEDELED